MEYPSLSERVKLFKDSDLHWGFDDKNPTFYVKTPNGKYGSHYSVDPWPCYSHNLDKVTEHAKRSEEIFPVNYNNIYCIFPFECPSRTNGQCSYEYIYNEDDKFAVPFEGVICLWGKRIPLCPQMTNYLLYHERNHSLIKYIKFKQLGKDNYEATNNKFDIDYANLRGLDFENSQGYGARKWHLNLGEIIVNDMRICIFDSEPELIIESRMAFPSSLSFWLL